MLEDSLKLSLTDGLGLGEKLGEAEIEDDGLTLKEGLTDGEKLLLAEGLAETETEGEGDFEALGEALADPTSSL